MTPLEAVPAHWNSLALLEQLYAARSAADPNRVAAKLERIGASLCVIDSNDETGGGCMIPATIPERKWGDCGWHEHAPPLRIEPFDFVVDGR